MYSVLIKAVSLAETDPVLERPRGLLYSGVTLVRFGDGAMGMGSGILDTRSEPAARGGCRSLDNDTNRLDDAPNCPDDADG